MIAHMAKTGLRVDLAHFAALHLALRRDMESLTEQVKVMTGQYVNLDSGDQVAALLFKTLGLKQARPKLTKLGLRESVEDDVLTAIQHEHPVIPLCLDYKELSKLDGTYVSPMPKLARKVGFDHYRMYPNFNAYRVPSGRLAAKEPNLLAMPTRTQRGRDIRKGFITQDGYVYVSVDECLHPETLVETPTGPKAISLLIPGDKVLTHRGRHFSEGVVTTSSAIRPKPAYRITFSHGGSVIASYDHRWPTQADHRHRSRADIVIKETHELSRGRHLIPYLRLSVTVAALSHIGEQPMWAITVEPDHNYVLACGVVTQNSQIEMRVGAHESGDANLQRIYEQQEDIYSDFATSAFQLEDQRRRMDSGVWVYPTVDKTEHRFPAKTCVLASMYRVTGSGLLEQMPVVCATCGKPTSADKPGMPVHDCGRFRPLWNEPKCDALINAFYDRYPGLTSMQRIHDARAKRYGYTWDMWGRLLHTAAVKSIHEWVVSAALREAGNFPIQSGAQGTVKLTMAAVQDDLERGGLLGLINPLLQVHDELLFEAREDLAVELAALVASRFESCVRLDVPIKASSAIAPSWGLLEK